MSGVSCFERASSHLPQAGTRNAQSSQPDCFAFGTASPRIIADDSLEVVGTSAACPRLAAFVVNSGRLVVAALEVKEAFEAHFGDGSSLICRSLSESCHCFALALLRTLATSLM